MTDSPTPELSFVVIGYNEGKHIRGCLESVRAIKLPGKRYEIIYVDGGSSDNSVEEARKVDGVRVIGGEKRERREGEQQGQATAHREAPRLCGPRRLWHAAFQAGRAPSTSR